MNINTKSVSLKNSIIIFSIILFIFPVLIICKTNNIKIIKKEYPYTREKSRQIKSLPNIYRERFQKFPKPDEIYRKTGKDYEVNLLVLLVDFVREIDDDPKTTGNGKFDFGYYDYFEVDGVKDSIQTIGSPPHDSTYFHQCIVAMQYYYQTASLGVLNSFESISPVNFDFKIFPHQADTAYHLPHKMAYYNPDTEDWDLKTERFFEFFRDAITTADTTNFPNTLDINFSAYNHIIIIHAGSDWQHDVFWDTPCDLPGMFIHFDKEENFIPVNDSTYFVESAAIIPETISQDFYISGSGLNGCGAINGELFHEFGHSLGFVDLYNTVTWGHGAGLWDIMDYGGFGTATILDTARTQYINIEGVLPTLPSAWSRMLVWGDEFISSGKCIVLASPGDISIDAAELPYASNPQFIKISINDKEYFLLENRETDLDPHGPPDILCWQDTNFVIRVPLYPAKHGTEDISYEYDYFLPTYDPYLEAETNGGLCIWHIDDYVIYDEVVYIDGEPYSRFESNTVNGRTRRRGVRMVEADGIWDIGNPNSYYSVGCAYDPFFKTKPGFWTPTDTNRFHNYHFGPSTKPNSFTNEGINSLIEILNISNYGTTMNFTFQYQLYDDIVSIIPENKFNPENEILFFIDETIIYTKNIAFASDSVLYVNNDIFGDFTYYFNKRISQPISLLKRETDNFIIVAFDDSIALVNFNLTNYPPLSSFGTNTEGIISDSPIGLSEEKILVPTEDSLTIFRIENDRLLSYKNEEANYPKIAYNNSRKKIIVLNKPNIIAVYDTTLSPVSEFSIPTNFGCFYPVIENKDSTQIIYLQDEIGSIFKIEENELKKIFIGENYNFNEISNIALGDVNNDGIHDIVFTADNTIYAIQPNGALIEKFPIKPNAVNYSSSVSPIIGKSLLPDNISIFLPTASNWTQAISEDCEIVPEYSFSLGYSKSSPYMSQEDNSTYIYFPVSDSIIKIFSFDNQAVEESEIYWNGYKNGPERWGCLNAITQGKPDSTEYLKIIAFPNPAEKGEVRIRINSPENAYSSCRIYTLSAKLLFKDEIEIQADRNNEYVWNIDKIASGIYFAIVKVGEQKRLVKIGVAK
ncbi:MAG: T9SS type A sorting domain-containing protein [Candidatus Cloacimonetes bacterium]|nr:T9SS type A sorting domain-containing protein [Candidatus Cloacimonadota bacterium]